MAEVRAWFDDNLFVFYIRFYKNLTRNSVERVRLSLKGWIDMHQDYRSSLNFTRFGPFVQDHLFAIGFQINPPFFQPE